MVNQKIIGDRALSVQPGANPVDELLDVVHAVLVIFVNDTLVD